MHSSRFLIALSTLGLLAPAGFAQQNFDNVQIKSQHVRGTIHMLEGAGGNIGVSVGEDGFLIVDDQFAPLADKIKAALAVLGDGDLEFVLNTHFHGDHTGSNAVFGLEAIIVAQANVRERLSTPQTVRGQTTPAAPASALPVITFDDTMTMYFNGETIRLFHAPAGHTDGDSILYFESANVLHMGDHFFAGRFPFVDIDSGGTVQGMAANVARTVDQVPADVKIIPGHGPLSTLDDLRLYQTMLEDSLATVGKGIAAGKSIEDIQAAGLDPRWKGWGSGFINDSFWIQTVYRSLSQ